MKQRVKRDKGGRFNGSTGTVKKTAIKRTASKKTAASKPTAAERQAAQNARALAAGDKRVARIDKRTEARDTRIDRIFPGT